MIKVEDKISILPSLLVTLNFEDIKWSSFKPKYESNGTDVNDYNITMGYWLGHKYEPYYCCIRISLIKNESMCVITNSKTLDVFYVRLSAPNGNANMKNALRKTIFVMKYESDSTWRTYVDKKLNEIEIVNKALGLCDKKK